MPIIMSPVMPGKNIGPARNQKKMSEKRRGRKDSR
jgi:hypothetical protein